MKIRFGLLIATFFVIMIGMSSCIRSYTCECRISYSGQPGLPDTVFQDYPLKDTKKKAKSVCESNSSVTVNGTITTTEECYLY